VVPNFPGETVPPASLAACDLHSASACRSQCLPGRWRRLHVQRWRRLRHLQDVGCSRHAGPRTVPGYLALSLTRAPAPEPSTCAIMLAGFASLGFRPTEPPAKLERRCKRLPALALPCSLHRVGSGFRPMGRGALMRVRARSAQLRLRVDLPHPADLRPAAFSPREKERALTQTFDRRRRPAQENRARRRPSS
jgi:hypothetical protein